LNKPPPTSAVVFTPMAMAHCNGPLDEHDALPVESVPVRPEEKQASNAWAGAGATLVANALAATAPNTPPATSSPVMDIRVEAVALVIGKGSKSVSVSKDGSKLS
jgi:hypothetical protein